VRAGSLDHAARVRIARRGWAPSGRGSSVLAWRERVSSTPPAHSSVPPPTTLACCTSTPNHGRWWTLRTI